MASSPWGGSEELWSRGAMRLSAEGHSVFACVKAWPRPAEQVQALAESGVKVYHRSDQPTTIQRVINKLAQKAGLNPPCGTQVWLQRLLKETQPDLIVVSQGGISDGLLAMETANLLKIPYVSVVQANSESFWPNDEIADRLLSAAKHARLNMFVAQANRDLFFRQIGHKLDNCSIVWNPPNPSAVYDGSWPETDVELSLACVARLDPIAKGQDILFEVLAQPQWRERSVRLHLYGSGMNPKSLRRHAKSLGIEDKVKFEGQVSDISTIWKKHHALILPSRFEGTPLSLIEAMLCGRPAICTAVAGMAELVQETVNGFVAEAATIPHLSMCMERAWGKRRELQKMGQKAKSSIEYLMPNDPIDEFKQRLISKNLI